MKTANKIIVDLLSVAPEDRLGLGLHWVVSKQKLAYIGDNYTLQTRERKDGSVRVTLRRKKS